MSSRRAALTAAAAGFMAGCGGGGSAGGSATACAGPGTLVSVIADSTWSGTLQAAPGSSETVYLEVPPILRLQQQLGAGYRCIDHAVPGTKAADLVGNWAYRCAVDPADVQVFGLGGGDVLAGTDIAAFTATMTAMIDISQARGKRIVLVGVIDMARKPDWQPWSEEQWAAFKVRADAFNGVIVELARRRGLPVVDMRAQVPFLGAADIGDMVHPSQAYSDRRSPLVAEAVLHA